MEPASSFQLFGLTAVNLAYGFMMSNQGLLLAPLESERLFPGAGAIGLAGFAACGGVAMLIGPAAGKWSDQHRTSEGRRFPCVTKSAVFTVLLTLLLPIFSSWRLGGIFMTCFFLQQVAWSVLQPVQYALVPDFVPVEQRGTAGGLTAANMLVGALAGLLAVRFVGADAVYTHYFIQMGLVVACVLLAFYVASTMKEVESSPSPQAKLAEPSGEWSWMRDLPNSYKFDAQRNPEFAKLLLSKVFYGASVIVKAYLLFFVQDTFNLHDLAREQKIVGNAAVAAEATAALAAGAGIYLLMRPAAAQGSGMESSSSAGIAQARRAGMSGAMWMALLWLGPLIVGYGVAASLDDFETTAAYWSQWMVIGTALWGFGQGVYVAGDQALGYSLLPDRNEAARYLGLFGVVSAVGAIMGGSLAGGALHMFGDVGRDPASQPVGGGPGYGLAGYTAMFLSAAALSLTCCALLFSINSKPDRETAHILS